MNRRTLLLSSFLFLLLLSTMAYPLAQLTPSSAPSSSSSSSSSSPSAPSSPPPSPLPSASEGPLPSRPRPRVTPDRWLTLFDRWLILFSRGLTAAGFAALVLRYLRQHPELAERIPPGIRDYVVRGRFDAWEARTQRQLLGVRQLLGKGHPLYPCMRKCCRDVLTANLLSLDRYTYGAEAMTLEEAFIICGRPDQCGLDEQSMAIALERAAAQQQARPQSAPPSPSPSSSSLLSSPARQEQGSSLTRSLQPPSTGRKEDDRLGNGQAPFSTSATNIGRNGKFRQNEYSIAQLLRTAPTPAAVGDDGDDDDNNNNNNNKAMTTRVVLDTLSQHARLALAGTVARKEERGRSAQIRMPQSPLPLTAPFLRFGASGVGGSGGGGGIPGSKAFPSLPVVRH